MKLIKTVAKFIEAVWVSWLFFGGAILFLDWWVSTEMEFLSTKGEWEFLIVWSISLGIYITLKHKVGEKGRGDSQQKGKVRRKI